MGPKLRPEETPDGGRRVARRCAAGGSVEVGFEPTEAWVLPRSETVCPVSPPGAWAGHCRRLPPSPGPP
jgi:hypothetical protein